MQKFKVFSILFFIGGLGYNLIEIFWRGYTHVSMFFAGGICFNAFSFLGKRFCKCKKTTLCFLGAATVTAVEFTIGCIVNLWLKKRVWDYSRQPLNILGQVCPFFSFLWGVLSFVFIPVSLKIESAINKLYNCNN